MKRLSMIRPVADEWVSGGKALVVDADPLGRGVLVSLLKTLGFSVMETLDGEAAIAVFERESPDIVFADFATVGIRCPGTVPRIKALAGERFVPVIVMTSPAQEDALVDCIESGGGCLDAVGDDFLGKPINPAHLRAKIAAFARAAQLYRTVQAQHDELVYEQELAKQVYAKTAMADPSQLAVIQSLQRPASVFSGDILLVERSPSGALHVLVGDFTGHGLAAAIGALPAADVFRGMTAKGFTPSEILTEINRKLRQTLPTGMFLAAVLVCLDEGGRWAGIRNSGLPDVLILGQSGGMPRHRIPSASIPLGIMDSIEPAELVWIEVDPGDRIVVVTDGIVEARDPAGEFFGDGRFLSCLANGAGDGAFDRLVEGLDGFIGGALQEDDLTLAMIPCARSNPWPESGKEAALAWEETAAAVEHGAEDSASALPVADWHWDLELGATALRRLDVVPLLVDTVVHLQGLREHRQPLFTILSELFNNALDHGLLRLESCIKDSPEGFARYFRERRDRLAQLERGRVRIGLAARLENGGGRLEIHIEDDGPGFDFASWKHGFDQQGQFSGRGIGLVRALCESLDFENGGNVAKAVFRW